MKQLALIIIAATALVACDATDEDSIPPENEVIVVNEDGGSNVDECPRADGTPCR